MVLAVAVSLIALGSPAKAGADQPVSLWLPWEGGTLWTYTQGPHGDYGEGLDFQAPDQAGKPCDIFRSSFWVVAAADGVVRTLANAIEIDHGDGFTTGYYHVENPQVKTGDRVKAGDRLGAPACCPDGWGANGCWVTGPHLHFYTLTRGVKQSAIGLNLGGWRVMEDGCLARAGQQSCPIESGGAVASIVSNSPRQGESSPSTAADLVVVVDTSGGFSDAAVAARKDAAQALLQATRPDDRVSFVEFNSSAQVLAPLSETVVKDVLNHDLIAAADAPEAGGRTNIRLGLVTGCAELINRGKAPARAAILLSDGNHNKGSFSGAEECFKEAGIPVFAYGVGPSNQFLLKRLAEKTGGEFRMLSDVQNPYCEFRRIRTILSGDPPGDCTTFQVKAGETLTLPFQMPEDQDQAVLEVRWRERRTAAKVAEEGIPVVSQIISPASKPLTIPFPGITYEEQDGAVRYTIAYPLSGEWKLIVATNEKAPPEGLFVTFSASTITQASPYYELPQEEDIPTEVPVDTPVEIAAETETPAPSDTETPRPTRGLPATPTPEPTPTGTQPPPDVEPPPLDTATPTP